MLSELFFEEFKNQVSIELYYHTHLNGISMKKIDLKKELKEFYRSSAKKVQIVTPPSMNFLKIDGQGNPNTSAAFQDAVATLFAVSYTLKFTVKKGEMAIDYGVMPLEGLWHADNIEVFDAEDKDSWRWTLMVMQPEFITEAMVLEAKETAQKKNKAPLADKLRFEIFEEGKAAQIMHVGPFSDEGPTVDTLHAYIKENGFEQTGAHHEIYLSDIRRAAPQNWKTIIRQPIK